MTLPLGETLLILLVFVLFVMRITRLINGDRILAPLRLYPAGKLRQAQMQHAYNAQTGDPDLIKHSERWIRFWDSVVYLTTCPWCVSMWVGLATAIVPVLIIGWPWWALFPVALATSHLVGVFARFADTEEIEIEDAPPVQ